MLDLCSWFLLKVFLLLLIGATPLLCNRMDGGRQCWAYLIITCILHRCWTLDSFLFDNCRQPLEVETGFFEVILDDLEVVFVDFGLPFEAALHPSESMSIISNQQPSSIISVLQEISCMLFSLSNPTIFCRSSRIFRASVTAFDICPWDWLTFWGNVSSTMFSRCQSSWTSYSSPFLACDASGMGISFGRSDAFPFIDSCVNLIMCWWMGPNVTARPVGPIN